MKPGLPVRFGHVHGGRQHLVVKCLRDFDEPRHTCGALGVADHRFDRAEGAGLERGALLLEHGLQGLDLGLVPGHRAGAVSLDQSDRGGRETGLGVSSPKGLRLPGGPRCGQALLASVSGTTDTLDDGVDPVAVALGVGEPLQHQRGDAFTDRDAVGALVEGATPARRRQCLGLRETEIHEGVLSGVGATGDHEITGPALQFVHREVECREGGRAGGVHGAVETAEIEPIRDSPGGDVHQDPRERVLGPLG